MEYIDNFIDVKYGGDACDFYRDVVAWMDYRNEHLNQGKRMTILAVEFIEHVKGD